MPDLTALVMVIAATVALLACGYALGRWGIK